MTGGDKLQAALSAIVGKLSTAETVRVGFLENSTYPDGTSVPMVAAIQEFGAPKVGIPPRPYFRSMIAAKAPGWGAAMGKVLKATDYDAAATLGQMGQGIAGQLRDSIIATDSPALAPATIAAKGSAKPLVDTGHMLQSVDYEVKT
jgi:hypothetical protein